MATESALGRQKDAAIQRIEQRLIQFGQGREFKLPAHSRHGEGQLLIDRLNAIADYLESIDLPQPSSKYESKSLIELKALAKERGGSIASLTTKATLIKALEAADKAGEMETENG